jgi:hypothetical protein
MKVKYPKTRHLSFSKGLTRGDKVIKTLSNFIGKEIVALMKMDGENSTLMKDCIFARSLENTDHESQHWLKGLWGNINYEIPDEWRICGENLFAEHSISYKELPSYFMVFNIWDENNRTLSYDDTIEWCDLLKLEHTPLLWRGIFDENILKDIASKFDTEKNEGFVIRLTESFDYKDFETCTAKWVRASHVKTSSHWKYEKIVRNGLKSDNNLV